MGFERTPYYPEHDRTSCSDADPCNAEAGGSHGCARCTAIMMDERDVLAERCERLEAALLHCENMLIRYEINRIDGEEISDVALGKIRHALGRIT